MNTDQLKIVLASGDVMRYHSMPSIREKQSNAHHQWRAAMILNEICNFSISKDMLMACLLHDFCEIFTGDIPSPIKWDNQDLKNILTSIEDKITDQFGMYKPSQQEKDAIKIADCLEMIIYIYDNFVQILDTSVIRRIRDHIQDILNRYDGEFDVDKIIKIIEEQ